MSSISLCMIVKNEEDVLERCLESVQSVVDEIIIVDTGSCDSTIAIAKKFTDNIYHFTWCDDFAKARNYSFSKATKDYIMWLDADDIITLENQKRLIDLKKQLALEPHDIIMAKYHIRFDENDIPTYSYFRERIVKRDKNYQWISPIHEVIDGHGKTLYSDFSISHKKIHPSDSNRNLRIFEKMKKNKVHFDARQKFYYARELYYHHQDKKAIKEFETFLLDSRAWKENLISACLDLATIYFRNNQPHLALQTLFRSFEFDLPRGEVCCAIANYFFDTSLYTQAIFWYQRALEAKVDIHNGGFYDLNCYHFIPAIQLCLCYYYLNDIPTAIYYNELAGKSNPNEKHYLQNKAFFESLSS